MVRTPMAPPAKRKLTNSITDDVVNNNKDNDEAMDVTEDPFPTTSYSDQPLAKHRMM